MEPPPWISSTAPANQQEKPVQFGYHNHSLNSTPPNRRGKLPYDFFLAELDPSS